ncbi:uncharacterized protein [Dendrobates tinctorius]|uniref:uncharacterized protein n=1 Tax=Dendrobates tinctorius TaxID=92724 RepID=UPI003CCA6C78
MKDCFNRDVHDESQVRSGSAARTRTRYRYRELAFLRPVLATRDSWSSTLQPVPGAVLHQSALDPSQPSDSQEASCRSATQTTGDQEAGLSGLPLSQVSATGFAGTSHQRQRASDRNVMPEFLHLSSAFQNGLKALAHRVESGFALMKRGFNHMDHRFHSVDSRLDRLEADLNRPAHHFFCKIERAMAEHLSPDLQLTVMQACNNAFLQAMQQSQYGQQSVVAFPPLPPLTSFTSLPTSAAYHCTATCIPSQARHHYTTPSQSAAGYSTDTTMASGAPVWTNTATTTPAWSTGTTTPAWHTGAENTPDWSTSTETTPAAWSTATTPPARSTATSHPPMRTATAPPDRSTATAPPDMQNRSHGDTITCFSTQAMTSQVFAREGTTTGRAVSNEGNHLCQNMVSIHIQLFRGIAPHQCGVGNWLVGAMPSKKTMKRRMNELMEINIRHCGDTITCFSTQ